MKRTQRSADGFVRENAGQKHADEGVRAPVRMKLPRFNSIESIIADLQKGKMAVVVDDADRENEGDLIMAAQFITPSAVNFMAKHGRGLICVPTNSERLQQLGIERMVR